MFYSIFVCAHYQLSGGGIVRIRLLRCHLRPRHSVAPSHSVDIELAAPFVVGAGYFLFRCWHFAYLRKLARHAQNIVTVSCEFESVFDLPLLRGNAR